MNETNDAINILTPFWRFKWLILAVGFVVAGVTYGYYNSKGATYETPTEINLANGLEEQGITPTEPVKKRGRKAQVVNPNQIASSVINSPIVHGVTAARLRGL